MGCSDRLAPKNFPTLLGRKPFILLRQWREPPTYDLSFWPSQPPLYWCISILALGGLRSWMKASLPKIKKKSLIPIILERRHLLRFSRWLWAPPKWLKWSDRYTPLKAFWLCYFGETRFSELCYRLLMVKWCRNIILKSPKERITLGLNMLNHHWDSLAKVVRKTPHFAWSKY